MKRFMASLIIFFIFSLQAHGEQDWILLEKAKLEILNKEYGNALVLLKSALELNPNYPEAYLLLGEIYLVDGEVTLAKKQFDKAYELNPHLDTPADKFIILYRLCDIYKDQKDWINWGLNLQKLIKEDTSYYNDLFLRFENSFLKAYREDGVNRFLVLYRIKGSFALRAHRSLGWLYYKSGNFDKAIVHYLFALNISCSIVIEELRDQDIRYEYKDMNSFLELALGYDYINEFLIEEGDFFSILYYLGGSSYQFPEYRNQGLYLWKVLKEIDPGGMYGKRASRQLISPWREELLDIDSSRLKDWSPDSLPPEE